MIPDHDVDFNCVAVIPARGGSKRIPKKNIKLLCGRPIIAYTIEAAINSGIFSRVIVSTDSHEVAAIARNYGADVPFLRGLDLSDDWAPVSSVTIDALRVIGTDAFDFVAQLMPNCPLRKDKDIRCSFFELLSAGDDFQISVAKFHWQNPWWAMTMNSQGVLSPIQATKSLARSQDLPELFCPSGAIWWAKIRSLISAGTFHAEGKVGFELPWYRAIDIDTKDDWLLAESLMKMPMENMEKC